MATMCVSGAVLNKAGKHVSAVMSDDLNQELEEFIEQAESFINVATRNNYTDSYSTLNADVQKLLQEACSNLAAIYAINYDMTNYPVIQEPISMKITLQARVDDIIKLLTDQKSVTYINGA